MEYSTIYETVLKKVKDEVEDYEGDSLGAWNLSLRGEKRSEHH